MDGYLIIQFNTEAEANFALAVINQIAAGWWQSQGYTVIDGQLIGKNAATGEDMPDSARTLSWDIPKESQIDTWYISSPANNEKFIAWRESIPDGVIIPLDEVMPEEWLQNIGV